MKRTTLKIQRPSGITEIVDVSDKFNGMNDTLFANIKAATKAAGRGEVLSYAVDDIMTDGDRDLIARYNAEGELDQAIANNDAKAAVAARAKLEKLGGHTDGPARDISRDAVDRALNLAD